MKKELFTVLVCIMMMMVAALPTTTALAGEDISTTGLDLSTPPTVVTTYTAGSGTVTWNPTVTPATLTFDGATIEMSESSDPVTAVKLPTSLGSVNVIFRGTNSITSTGIGFVILINAAASCSVTLTGSMLDFSGSVTGKVTLDDLTIPYGSILDLSQAESVTKGEVGATNNGMLVLKDGTSVSDIEALQLTGFGYVTVMGESESYYTNDGETIHESTALYFDEGEYKEDASLEMNGYEYRINANGSYTLTLGNLLINAPEQDAITLPKDGNVTVVLANGTTTRINSGCGIKFTGVAYYDNIITGEGKLDIQSYDEIGSIQTTMFANNLTISGGDITITNSGGAGIAAIDDTAAPSISIIGGMLTINAQGEAIKTRNEAFLGSGMRITSPKGAKVVPREISGTELVYYVIVDANDNLATNVIIQPAPAPDASPVTVYNDPSVSNATIWLTGRGLDSGDQLNTVRNPQGSKYEALTRLAIGKDVVEVYDISLRSGYMRIGQPLTLTCDFSKEFPGLALLAGESFTLVHRRYNGTHEYFYDTANADGTLNFGPLYELSPFMLVRGRLDPPTPPDTGDNTPLALWLSVMLIASVTLAGLLFFRRRENQR